ncbi:hypothetical protein Pla100_55780 [Neorhodopirellula pilleata]|uniref:Uncharacterized protein n=1 Tax=Neorhodopirellula pilleata TaxID=2714738 RepID=A0A5C5ZQR6_9BACT|nr:hypothetical protein Pla100_55780 [Neorhodopirellula pilleata]
MTEPAFDHDWLDYYRPSIDYEHEHRDAEHEHERGSKPGRAPSDWKRGWHLPDCYSLTLADLLPPDLFGGFVLIESGRRSCPAESLCRDRFQQLIFETKTIDPLSFNHEEPN